MWIPVCIVVPRGSLRRPTKAAHGAGIKFTDIQLDRYNREKVRISDGFARGCVIELMIEK